MTQSESELTTLTSITSRYKVLSVVGRGGMATVYKVHDQSTNDIIALKLLHADQSLNSDKVDRFIAEYDLLSSLAHPNIVRVYDKGVTEQGVPYFTLSLVEGFSLSKFINTTYTRQKLISELELLEEILSALSYIHAQGIVYRDVSPNNIIVSIPSAPKGASQVTLIDFGIAHRESGDKERKYNKVGTAHYMSPEIYRGEGGGIRSDIYSFGIVAFELLTGVLPYNPEIEYKVEFHHKLAELPSARSINTLIPRSLDRIIKRCIEKEVEDRFPDAEAIRVRIEEVVQTLRTPSLLERFLKLFSQRSIQE